LDIIISGNDYGNELAIGRLDASKSVLLLGNGKGNFKEVTFTDSGLNLDGDSKGLVKLNYANGNVLLINSVNRGKLRFYKLK
jgi:enediyne biosynthesis protein E4